ncbi:MAG: zinc ABC transporter substrate-binding protein [Myxococcales bacterium]|nr:zinc ABC transporter substrate-binding protein [Myxococcales bacterium]
MTFPLALLLACGTPEPSDAPAPTPTTLDVAALSFPAAWLAERVGGEAVTVRNIAPPGEDPPHWQPPAEVVASLGEADLIVANGAGFEGWLATASVPEERLVRAADGLDLIVLEGRTHSHGAAGEHSHAGTDPHTWSDPLAFLAEAKTVHQALARTAPAHTATFDAGLTALQSELTALHEALDAALAPLRGRPLAANHPAFNYLARRYGLELTSFDLDPEEPPGAEAVAAVLAWSTTAGDTPILLWESAPMDPVRQAFPASFRHVTLDPLEQPATATYDYLAQARANVATLGSLGP